MTLLGTKIPKVGISFTKWSRFIYPTILSHLSGTVNLQWKSGFFQFIIDKEYVSASDIEWNVVLENWPSCTTRQLFQSLDPLTAFGDRGVPLYQNLKNNLHRMKLEQKVP